MIDSYAKMTGLYKKALVCNGAKGPLYPGFHIAQEHLYHVVYCRFNKSNALDTILKLIRLAARSSYTDSAP